MTTPPPASTPAQIRDIAVALLEGSGLHVEQRPNELIVTNPGDPEKGQVIITLEDGYVSWERTLTEYWGHLEGISTSHDPGTPTVLASKIIEILTGRL
jgi:hypothetical protein